MEDYRKNSTTWLRQSTLNPPRPQTFLKPHVSSNISTSDANHSLNSPISITKKENKGSIGNPLKISFIHKNTNPTPNSTENGNLYIKKDNKTSFEAILVNRPSEPDDININKYTQLLSRIRPSFDLSHPSSPLLYGIDTSKSYNSHNRLDGSTNNSLVTKSILVNNNKNKGKVDRGKKKVGFDERVEVIEVENWKIYNVDTARKVNDGGGDKSARACVIF